MRKFSNYFAALGPYPCASVPWLIFYVAAFGTVQLVIMDGNGPSFSLTNILAALLVGISLYAEFNLASPLFRAAGSSLA